ncbi:MAG: hypothetical protein MJZ84_05540 [Paludibacteraceae bacterium]|nr:hypothetical protein [Paludibacteraceae bacterium]
MRKLYLSMLMAVGLLISGNAFGAAGQGHSEPQAGDVAKVSVDVAGVVTTTYYATLQDAFDDLPDNSYPVTLQMLDNALVTVQNGFEIHQYNNVTLDLNGKSISANTTVNKGSQVILNKGTLTITDESGTGEGVITSSAEQPDTHEGTPVPGYASNTITNNGTIYMKAGLVINTGDDPQAEAQYAIDNKGTLIMDGGSLQGRVPVRMVCNSNCTVKVEMNGGEIKARGNLALWAQIYDGGVADVIVNDGTIQSNGNSIKLEDKGKNNTARAKLHINGGTLYGDCSIEATTEDCEITGGTFKGGTLKCSKAYPHNQIMTGGIFIGLSKQDNSVYDWICYVEQDETTTGKNTENDVTQVTAWAKQHIIDNGDYWSISDGTTTALTWDYDKPTLTRFTKTDFPDPVASIENKTLVFMDSKYFDAGFSLGRFWILVKPIETIPSDYKNLWDNANEYIATGFSAQKYDGNGNPDDDIIISTTSKKETNNNGSWATPETWLPVDAPDAATDVTVKNEIVVESGIAEAHGVEINGEGQIVVKKGAVLEIGAGGIKTNNTEIQPIIVEAGGTLRVGVGGVSKEAGTLNPVEIYNDGINSGAFMINPNAQVNTMPEATITLTTNVRKDYWQHLALPIENLTEHSNDKGAANAVFEWKNNEWNQLGGWNEIKAFKGYDFTNNYEGQDNVTYTFKGQLVGVQNQGLSLIEGVNFFGNSYTAPISLSALFDQIGSDMESNTIEKTVYIYNSSTLNYGFTSQLGIQLAEMGYADLEFKTIAPLQGFWMNLQEGKGTAGTTINYAKAVWNNTEELGKPQYAPSRNGNSNNFSTVATIKVTAANGAADKVILVEGDQFSAEFENGSDASKMMSEESFNLFATTENGKQSMVATDNLEGTTLTFQAGQEVEYTMTFAKVLNNDYSLLDLLTNEVISLTEGNSYTFAAQPNGTEARFQIIATAKAPTAIENTKLVSATKMLKNGMLYIKQGENIYNAQGQNVK